MREHRVALLGDAWRRVRDPETSRDPQVRAVVEHLRVLSGGPGPDAAFRAELRAQLVAITPRILAETAESESAMVDIVPRPKAVVAATAKVEHVRRRIRVGRIVGIAASVVTVMALLLGGAVALSQRALPGDTLYGLKRATEQFQLDTDGSNTERAADLLDFAGTRADEVRSLIGRATASAAGDGVHAAGGLDAHTVSLIKSTLGSADSDVRDASSLLTKQAVQAGSPVALSTMTDWAPRQAQRLAAIYAATADPSVRQRARQSQVLVGQARVRAKQLMYTVDCTCMAHAGSDALGPKPCHVCPTTSRTRTNPAPGHTTTPTTGRGITTGPSAGEHPTGGHVSVPSTPTLGGTTRTSPAPGSSKGGSVTLPTAPVTLPTQPPIVINSCGVTLPGLGVGLSLCPSPSHSH